MEPEGGGWGISEKVRRRVDFLERSCRRETQRLRCQVIRVPFGEVGRKQNRGSWAGEAQSVGKERGEVALDPECFARSSAAESRGIENDGFKSLTALGEATEVGRHILGDEAVMFNTRGRPASAAAANLVFRIDGEIVTPPLSEGILAGTTRTRLLAALPEIVERRLTRAEAKTADALVLTNALRGLRPALSWDGRDLPGSGELRTRLEDRLSLAEDRDSLG